jgi:hypothetical protein
MKRYKNTCLIFLFLLVGLGACDSTFLDEKPYSFVSPEVFYQTANDAEIGLNGVYRTLNDVWNDRYFSCSNLGNDEMAYGLVKTDNTPHAAYTFSSTLGFQNDLWIMYYKGINSANYLLDQVPTIEMDETRQTEILAEAKFLRAFYYFNLAGLFGGVPLDVTAAIETDLPRASLQKTYSFIIDELKDAHRDLPANHPQTGKVNKDAAAALLAKVGLYLAACKENGTGSAVAATYDHPELISFDWVDQTAMYQMAYDYASEVYGKYELIENYDYLFLAETEEEANAESVFGVQFHVIESDPTYLSLQKCFYPKGKRNLGGGLGWNSPTSEMYELYNMDMDFRGNHNLTDEMDNSKTFEFRGSTYHEVKPIVAGKAKNYSCGKWRHSTYYSRPTMPDWAADINMHVIRYADVLLMYAEAIYKHLQDENQARAILTELRGRAVMEGFAATDLDAAYANADFMTELMEERSRELCFEGWRRIDLIRTNTLESALMALDPTNTKPAKYNANITQTQDNFAPFKIWFPIPLRELDLNENLFQNPEW